MSRNKKLVVGLLQIQDKLLICKSVDKNCWGLPCGNRRIGEHPEDAIRRIFSEKYGIQICKTRKYWNKIVNSLNDCNYTLWNIICTPDSDDFDGFDISGQEFRINEYTNGRFITFDEFMDMDELSELCKQNISWIKNDNHNITRYQYIFEHSIHRNYTDDEIERYISNQTKTLPIMDEFDGIKPGKAPFKRLLIPVNMFPIKTKTFSANYSIIIEHSDELHSDLRAFNKCDELTMAKFKSCPYSIVNKYKDEILKGLNENSKLIFKDFYFMRPPILRAQNSDNREGFYAEWYAGMYLPGKQYGDTNTYEISGIRFNNIRLFN